MTPVNTYDDQLSAATPIWRYMDLAKFVMLVSNRKLWFSKGVTLRAGDPYEGYGLATAFANEAKPGTYSAADGVALMLAEAGHLAAKQLNEAAHHQYVSSWCYGCESLAMWMLYGADGRGVAIRSTVDRFIKALKQGLTPDHYRFGRVRYHETAESFKDAIYDFRQGTIPMSGSLWQKVLALAFNKRSAYAYEQEWRAAIYQDRRPKVVGLDIPVDLAGLVSDVYVGPKATALDVNAVAAVMKNAGLEGKPHKSLLLAAPKKVSSGLYVRSAALQAAASRAIARGDGGFDRTSHSPRRKRLPAG
jgi:hypothetical protein